MGGDIHLKKSEEWCQLQNIEYDYFMKLETVDTDENLFIETIMGEKQYKMFHMNKVSNNSENGWATKNFTKVMSVL